MLSVLRLGPRFVVQNASYTAARRFATTSHWMPIEASIREKLTQHFSPSVLNVRNDSSKHAHHAAMVAQGGGNGETRTYIEDG